MERSALISEDGLYRYKLTRRWAGGPTALWIMLNPSIADDTIDDATMKVVIDLTHRSKMGACVVVNLFALRSRDPDDLLHSAAAGIDPVGPENAGYLVREIALADSVVAAWGANAATTKLKRPDVERYAFEQGRALWCYGRNKGGSPKHPLYLKRTTEKTLYPNHRGQGAD